jgi:hypothetical protein
MMRRRPHSVIYELVTRRAHDREGTRLGRKSVENFDKMRRREWLFVTLNRSLNRGPLVVQAFCRFHHTFNVLDHC